MHQCLGPCINKEDFDYSIYTNKISSFLNGDADSILKELEEKMISASENMEFEKAIEYRDLINSIKNTIKRQKISINDLTARDYIGVYEDNGDLSLNIIITRLGSIVQNHQTIINSYISKEDEVLSYLRQFYEINEKPKEIGISGINIENIDELLGIPYVDIKLGKKKELLDIAVYNAKYNLENKRNIYKNQVLKRVETINLLGELLGIDPPERIEAFDNSILFGEYPVSGKVCYINGRPAPKEFRKYHIKTVEGANDYESMKEVIYRRYLRLLMEDSTLPNLIVMDGGKIQVHAAEEVLASLNVDIPVMGIQKDGHHKATIIFFKDKLIRLDKNDPVFLLLADISQRVHDFAISFFRSQKAKGFLQSRLDEIEGLGPKRKEALIKYFTTIDNVKNASIDELKKSGMPENLAKRIYEYFKEDDDED
jgi:excinuclease ABC subunit C